MSDVVQLYIDICVVILKGYYLYEGKRESIFFQGKN